MKTKFLGVLITLLITVTTFGQVHEPVYSGDKINCPGSIITVDSPSVDLSNSNSMYWFEWHADSCTGATVRNSGANGETLELPAAIGNYKYFVSMGYYNDDSGKTYLSKCTLIDVTISAPTPNLGKDTAIAIGKSIILDAGPGALYDWNDGTSNRTKLVSDSGTYWVDVADSNVCIGSDTINVSYINPKDTIVRVHENNTPKYFLFYPNPVVDIINIKTAYDTPIESIRIHELSGRLILETTSPVIDVAYLNPGIYILTINTKVSYRFLKH